MLDEGLVLSLEVGRLLLVHIQLHNDLAKVGALQVAGGDAVLATHLTDGLQQLGADGDITELSVGKGTDPRGGDHEQVHIKERPSQIFPRQHVERLVEHGELLGGRPPLLDCDIVIVGGHLHPGEELLGLILELAELLGFLLLLFHLMDGRHDGIVRNLVAVQVVVAQGIGTFLPTLTTSLACLLPGALVLGVGTLSPLVVKVLLGVQLPESVGVLVLGIDEVVVLLGPDEGFRAIRVTGFISILPGLLLLAVIPSRSSNS